MFLLLFLIAGAPISEVSPSNALSADPLTKGILSPSKSYELKAL
jgi:hypothetical protein